MLPGETLTEPLREEVADVLSSISWAFAYRPLSVLGLKLLGH